MGNSMVNLTSRTKTYIINLLSSLALIALVLIVFSGKLFVFSEQRYFSLILTSACVFIVLAVSLNLTTGCLGEMVLGHAAFMAVGAYSSSLFIKIFSFDGTLVNVILFYISLGVAFIVAGIFGLILGIPALRLKGDYLAIITLGFGIIFVNLIEVFEFTGAAAGLKQIPENTTLIHATIVVIVVVTMLFTFMRSRYGRAILAIREDEIAAEASGIPVTKYKVATFAFSAAIAGIGGALFAQSQGTIMPKNFTFLISIEILVIVVLGGLGSFTGSIIAAIVLTALPEALRQFSDYRMVVYSLLLIIVMLTRPQGLLGRYEFSMTKFLKQNKELPRIFKKLFKKKGSINDE